jgi:hypothetical protein
VIQNNSIVRNTAALLIFIVTTAAAVYLELSIHFPNIVYSTHYSHPDIVRFISYSSFSFVVLFSLRNQHTLPLLALLLCIKLLQFPISLFLNNFENALYYYLCSALLDLMIAFGVVHYHNDRYLLTTFNAQSNVHVPQVMLMASLLAISSLFSCLQAVEYILYRFQPELYEDTMPFLYTHQVAIKLTLKTLFDACVWSLLLDPNRWKILQKIQNKFLAP